MGKIMETLILVVIFGIFCAGLIGLGIYMIARTNHEGWGGLLLMIGIVLLTSVFPPQVEKIEYVGTITNILTGIAYFLQTYGWAVCLILACLSPFFIWIAADRTRSINLINWRASQITPQAAQQGQVQQPNQTHGTGGTVQVLEIIVLTAIMIFLFCYSYYLYESAPSSTFQELNVIADEYDGAFKNDVRLHSFYKASGRIRSSITLTKTHLSTECVKSMIDTVNQIGKDCEDLEWKGVTAKAIKSVTLYSFDNREWKKIQVIFDAILPVTTTRTTAETVEDVKVLFDNNQAAEDISIQNQILIEQLSMEVLQKVGVQGLSNVVSGQKVVRKATIGRNLISARQGSTFQRTK